MVISGAVDATGTGTHLVEQTGGKCGGEGIRNQQRGGHLMATSVFTQYAIQDLHDHSLRCVFFFFF